MKQMKQNQTRNPLNVANKTKPEMKPSECPLAHKKNQGQLFQFSTRGACLLLLSQGRALIQDRVLNSFWETTKHNFKQNCSIFIIIS